MVNTEIKKPHQCRNCHQHPLREFRGGGEDAAAAAQFALCDAAGLGQGEGEDQEGGQQRRFGQVDAEGDQADTGEVLNVLV